MDLLGGYGSDDSSEGGSKEGQSVTIPIVQLPPTSSISRHGKKLVSLHAVLPLHLFELLTKGGVGDDSDDDNPADAPKLPQVKPLNPVKRGADAGLTCLLSELGSVSRNTISGTASMLIPEKMGLAFSHSQTYVTSKVNQTAILDIHGETMENSLYDEDHDQIVVKGSVPATSATREPTPITRVHLSVPRPPAFRATVHESQFGTDTTKALSGTLYAAPGPIDQSEPVEQIMDPRLAKKRSRREIERALRSGDLDVVDDSVQFQTLDAESNVDVLDQSAGTAQNRSGVRIAPVAMYDTKAGKDVLGAGVSGKAKSKNQINFLMASAAAFEANEAQTTRVKTQRANAKRKYGW